MTAFWMWPTDDMKPLVFETKPRVRRRRDGLSGIVLPDGRPGLVVRGEEACIARLTYLVARALDLPARPVRWLTGPRPFPVPMAVSPIVAEARAVLCQSSAGVVLLEGGGLARPLNTDAAVAHEALRVLLQDRTSLVVQDRVLVRGMSTAALVGPPDEEYLSHVLGYALVRSSMPATLWNTWQLVAELAQWDSLGDDLLHVTGADSQLWRTQAQAFLHLCHTLGGVLARWPDVTIRGLVQPMASSGCNVLSRSSTVHHWRSDASASSAWRA